MRKREEREEARKSKSKKWRKKRKRKRAWVALGCAREEETAQRRRAG